MIPCLSVENEYKEVDQWASMDQKTSQGFRHRDNYSYQNALW